MLLLSKRAGLEIEDPGPPVGWLEPRAPIGRLTRSYQTRNLSSPGPGFAEDRPGMEREHLTSGGAQRCPPQPGPPCSPVTRPQHQGHLLLCCRHSHQHQQQPRRLPGRQSPPGPSPYPSSRSSRHHRRDLSCPSATAVDQVTVAPHEPRPASPLVKVYVNLPKPQVIGLSECHSGRPCDCLVLCISKRARSN